MASRDELERVCVCSGRHRRSTRCSACQTPPRSRGPVAVVVANASARLVTAAITPLLSHRCCVHDGWGDAGESPSDFSCAATATEPWPLTKQEGRALDPFGQMPLTFEANLGQSDPRVKFLSRGVGYTLLLAPTEAVLSLRSPSPQDARSRSSKTKAAAPEPSTIPSLSGVKGRHSPRGE